MNDPAFPKPLPWCLLAHPCPACGPVGDISEVFSPGGPHWPSCGETFTLRLLMPARKSLLAACPHPSWPLWPSLMPPALF